ncbi:MAG: porphobilinogen synthase [Candidatus Omnitrophica bacterium]|nr:porphobilinogen synthase [Candidatus Omnitrophota bacterium]
MIKHTPDLSSRLQKNPPLRAFARQALVMPFFVVEGRGIRNAVPSMPGVYQLSVDRLIKEVAAARSLGVPAVILFGVPSAKNLQGSSAYAEDGIVQQAVRAIKKHVKDILVITDVCLCEYTSHGHCGVLRSSYKGAGIKKLTDFIDLKKTLYSLAQTALSHARAGADMVAPSAMMPLQVAAIRSLLDQQGFKPTPIMSYSAKFASAYYGPFRDAADSAPQFGDRRTYQLDPGNAQAALTVVLADIAQGADIVMVKPGLPYLDIIRQIKDKINVPLAVYNVSGEYAMVKSAAQKGWVDEKKIMLENFNSFKRAGAGIVISYHACDLAGWLK